MVIMVVYILFKRVQKTVRSNQQVMERYQLNETGTVIIEGRAIGHRIGSGTVKVIHNFK